MTLASSLNWTQLTFCGKRVKQMKRKESLKIKEMKNKKPSPQHALWICVRRCLCQRPRGSPSYRSCRNTSGCCRRSCENKPAFWQWWMKLSSLGGSLFRYLHIGQTFTKGFALQSPVGIQNLVAMTSVCLQQGALSHTPQLQRLVGATRQQIVPIHWWCREERGFDTTISELKDGLNAETITLH